MKTENRYNKASKFLLCFLLLVYCTSLKAEADEEKYFPPALGPIFAYKGGVNGFNNPLGRKNGIAINNIPDVGISAYVPLDFIFNLGLYIDLMYNTNSFLMKYNYNHEENNYTNQDKMQFSYFTVSPTFNHSGFILGFNVNVPVSANWEGVNISTSKLTTLLEVKVGYSHPVYFDKVGRLNLFINVSYALNGVYQDFVKDDPLRSVVPAVSPQIITNYYNPRPAGMQIGVNFLFNLIQLPDEYYE